MVVDSQTYKELMARWSSGVSIVTTTDLNQIYGLTVSSFMSVSLSPPLVAISITKRLHACTVINQHRIFAINILQHDQIEWGKIFAGMYPDIEDRFTDIQYTVMQTQCPIFPDTVASLDCKVTQAIEAGDHYVFIGEVVEGHWNQEKNVSPLLYHNRMWGQFYALDGV